jgi:hypothetical protein
MGEPDPLRVDIREKIAYLKGALNLDFTSVTHEDKIEAFLAFSSKTSEDGWMADTIHFDTQDELYKFLDNVELLIRIARAQQRGE